MNEGKQPRRWLRAFPRAWRDRYGGELQGLVEDLRAQGDLRSSDRIDLVRRGLAMRRDGLRRHTVLGALGIVAATVCALVGLALAGTFGSQATTGPVASRGVIEELHSHGVIIELHTHGVPVPAQRVVTLCHTTTSTGNLQCPTEITFRSR